MRWWWIRIREGARWLARGSEFGKLEAEIDQMARPLSIGRISDKRAVVLRRRIAYAVSWLPPERGDKFREMMARLGHNIG